MGFVMRLRRQPGPRQAVIPGLVLGTAVLTGQESAVLAAIVVALVLLPWLLRAAPLARLCSGQRLRSRPAPAAVSASRPSAASPRTSPRSPAASPARSSGVRAPMIRA
jgi:hypothetical protein